MKNTTENIEKMTMEMKKTLCTTKESYYRKNRHKILQKIATKVACIHCGKLYRRDYIRVHQRVVCPRA